MAKTAQTKRTYRMRAAMLLGAAFVLAGCTTSLLSPDGLKNDGASSSSSGFAAGPAVSVESVRARDPQSRFGTREHPKIVGLYGGAYENPKLERSLARIVGKLVEVADDPGRAYQVTILNSPTINAFALPGGYVYVTRGLLALADDASEVAAVIAHEMGHVAASHGILRNEKAKDVRVANQVARDLLAGRGLNIAGAPARGKLLLAQFSRNQEFEADLLGIKISGRAGYDPYAQARYLESMARYGDYRSGPRAGRAKLDFLSTHPSTPKRVEFARKHARQFGAPGIGTRDRDSYLSGIEGMIFGDTAEEGFVRGRRYAHPGLRIAFEVPNGYRLDNRKEAVVATGPDRIALQVDAAPLAPNKSLEAYLSSGWIGGLTPEPPKALRINGLEALRGRAAADGWIFDITLVRVGDRVYRLITAAPAGVETLGVEAQKIATTFRRISARDAAALKPLEIKIHTVASGENTASVARRYMRWTDEKEGVDLLRALNTIGPGDLRPGQKIKLVVEG